MILRKLRRLLKRFANEKSLVLDRLNTSYMKILYRVFVLLFLVMHAVFVYGQGGEFRGFELTGKNWETLQIQQVYSSNAEVNPFEGKVSTVYSLALRADISFSSEKGLVRIILVDHQGSEYLVYESYPLLEDKSSFSIDNLCEETGALNSVTPKTLRIEVQGATLSVKSITFATAMAQGVDMATIRKEKKNLQNSRKINQINKLASARNLSWVAGETEVASLSYSEKKRLFGQSSFPAGIEYYVGGVLTAGDGLALKSASSTAMVETWDWRNRHGKNWVTGVKNQGSCGSCWAFASTGATEAQVNLFYNQPLNMDLSEQNILSCSGAGTCSGGYPSTALDYIKNTGIIDEAAFPYSATDQACTNKSSTPTDQIKIGGRVDFGSSAYPVSEDNLKKMMIKYGPISGGLLDWSHAMTLVGWQVVKEGDVFFYRNINKSILWYQVPAGSTLIGKTVWIFKNSWGSTWGDGGYIYVETSISNFAWTHALVAPLTSLKQNYTVQCVDNDHDGYYWWGTGSKPAGAPSCPASPDGNDADATAGPLDSYGNCIPLISAPAADFTADQNAVAENVSVKFTDLSVNAPTSWAWSFEGGTPASSTLQNPVVTYSTAGVYSVTLKATNTFGDGTLTKTNYITVSAPQLPVADFVSDKTIVLEGQSINFSDMSSDNPISWSWSIPGGTPSSSTLKNPTVSYKTSGKYDVTLVVTNANGNSTKIKTGYITVNANALTYASSHGNASSEWIAQASLNGSTYATTGTGSVGYADLTSKIFNVEAGKSYSLALTPGYKKANFWYWSVWIDLNHDYDFDDAGEQVLTASKIKTAVTKNISISSTAVTGPTRMRISMKRGALPLVNEVFAYGEVKDFTVNISAPSSPTAATKLKSANTEMATSVVNPGISLSVFPNPAEREVNLQLGEIFGNEIYRIYNMHGALVRANGIESTNTHVDVASLPAGMYVVKVQNGEQTLATKFIKR
jgi:PKD repeat protein/C1A family cysteine protease